MTIRALSCLIAALTLACITTTVQAAKKEKVPARSVKFIKNPSQETAAEREHLRADFPIYYAGNDIFGNLPINSVNLLDRFGRVAGANTGRRANYQHAVRTKSLFKVSGTMRSLMDEKSLPERHQPRAI